MTVIEGTFKNYSFKTIMLVNLRESIIRKLLTSRSSPPGVFCKKVLLEISQNLQENTCARISFLIKLQACEFCEIFKNTFFYRTPLVAVSGHLLCQIGNQSTDFSFKPQGLGLNMVKQRSSI